MQSVVFVHTVIALRSSSVLHEYYPETMIHVIYKGPRSGGVWRSIQTYLAWSEWFAWSPHMYCWQWLLPNVPPPCTSKGCQTSPKGLPSEALSRSPPNCAWTGERTYMRWTCYQAIATYTAYICIMFVRTRSLYIYLAIYVHTSMYILLACVVGAFEVGYAVWAGPTPNNWSLQLVPTARFVHGLYDWYHSPYAWRSYISDTTRYTYGLHIYMSVPLT